MDINNEVKIFGSGFGIGRICMLSFGFGAVTSVHFRFRPKLKKNGFGRPSVDYFTVLLLISYFVIVPFSVNSSFQKVANKAFFCASLKILSLSKWFYFKTAIE